jgi:hypothetical protein
MVRVYKDRSTALEEREAPGTITSSPEINLQRCVEYLNK